MTTTTPPITFGVRVRHDDERDLHSRVRIWAGEHDGARGLTGELVMRSNEAKALEDRLLGPDLSVEDLELIADTLFMRTRTTGSAEVRGRLIGLQERLQAEIDRRYPDVAGQ